MIEDLLQLFNQVAREYALNEALNDALLRFRIWWHSRGGGKGQFHRQTQAREGTICNDRPAREKFLVATTDLRELLKTGMIKFLASIHIF